MLKFSRSLSKQVFYPLIWLGDLGGADAFGFGSPGSTYLFEGFLYGLFLHNRAKR
jgi:hypothetical protein